MDRRREKNELFLKLGGLFTPMIHLIEHPELYNAQERAETIARYFHDTPFLVRAFYSFSQGQPGHSYVIESGKFQAALESLYQIPDRSESLDVLVRKAYEQAQLALDSVPVPFESVILEAGTPFTAYTRLKELCESDATTSLVWLDPYMNQSLFHRYLTSVRQNVAVILVTEEPKPTASVRERSRWNEFLDVSRLYAAERSSSLYRLIVYPSLHDRWVVFDDKRIYALGSSAKDAANKDYFTIAKVDASPQNLSHIQTHVNTGVEWFGPGTPTHR